MPLAGSTHTSLGNDDAPYFTSLTDLDAWMDKPSAKLEGVVPYLRPEDEAPVAQQGRLLVCHDYKGGYTESSTAMGYTFNFWQFCTTFIYFAHHRITIPPSGWTNAAHRRGVKMLGTLIFEGSGEEDCLRLVLGRLPGTKTGNASHSLSPHYARRLAELAHQRGFDGYLLNFECPLRGGVDQTRIVAAWISLFRQELVKRVGDHAEVIWYDSVVVTGQLAWQDRLNSVNVPFFSPSTGFFTNYTWPNHYPNATAQYFLNFPFPASAPPKALQDVYIGIDVWGRGSHGGGGFGAYRAIEHIDPGGLGLSAALFGPAWTWESEQDKPGFSWAHWWAYERRLWLGPTLPGELVLVPEMKHRTGEAPCTHGPFRPLAHAFASRPAAASFFTTFSPGVGRAWFVEGRKVMEQPAGWTDVDKQGSLGDLLWPRPQVAWEGDARAEPPPRATAEVIMDDAWLGGSAVRVSLAEDGVAPDDVDDAVFRCVWVPVQAVHLQPGVPYTVTLVYKPGAGAGVELDVGLSAKDASVRPLANEDLPHGWVRLRVELVLAGGAPRAVDVGLVVGLVMDDPAQPLAATLTLGMLAVHPARAVAYGAKLLWAAYTPSAPGARFPGVLAWDAAAAFAPPRPLALTSPEDLVPAWELADGPGWFPQFAYFNVYAARVPGAPAPETAVFVGTTGLDGRANRLLVEEGMMPPAEDGQGWRFYVQGVTLEGEVLPWERCASADLEL